MSVPCSIVPDPDIAGKGIRLAVYIQAILPMISHALIPFDPSDNRVEPSNMQTELAKQVYESGATSLRQFLLTNGALLITAYIKHSNGALSPYHALVVLNLNWIVYLSACFTSQMLMGLWPSAFPSEAARIESLQGLRRDTDRINSYIAAQQWYNLDDPWAVLVAASLCPFKTRQRPPDNWDDLFMGLQILEFITPLTMHTVAIGALGYTLFRDIEKFSSHGSCASEIVLWMFGVRTHIVSPPVQRIWHAIYIVALIPGFGASIGLAMLDLPGGITSAVLRCRCKHSGFPQQLPLWITFVVTLVSVSLFIASTEKTIAANPVGPGENLWGFGQVLALILVVFPTWETLKQVCLCVLLHLPPQKADRLRKLRDAITFGNLVAFCWRTQLTEQERWRKPLPDSTWAEVEWKGCHELSGCADGTLEVC